MYTYWRKNYEYLFIIFCNKSKHSVIYIGTSKGKGSQFIEFLDRNFTPSMQKICVSKGFKIENKTQFVENIYSYFSLLKKNSTLNTQKLW